MELMDFGTFVKDVGFPIAAATALMAFIWYGLRMTAQLIKRIVDLFDQNAKQIALLRELLDKRNAAEDLSNSKFQGLIESLAKAIGANTEATNASARSITDGLTQILGKAIESHAVQADRVIARLDTQTDALGGKLDTTLRGVESRLGERVDDGLKLVQVSTDALAVVVETQHQDNRAALDALHTATNTANSENAKTAGELRRLAELVESARNVQDERAQAVVAEIMKAITPRLDQIAETLRVVLERLTPPPTLPEPLPAADAAPVVAAPRVEEAKA
jgi:hypothetical protein